MSEKVEMWDIYDKDKKRTGRTMKRNDWCLRGWRIPPYGSRCHKKT